MGSRPDVLIIGGGPAGMASLIWAKRLGINALLLEKETELGGQLRHIYNKIIDYPGLPAADGRELNRYFVNHIKTWEECVCCGVEIRAVDVETKKVVFRKDGQDNELTARFLILAMGARQRRLGVPGEEGMMARGETYSAARDRYRFRGRKVAVVGGGDRALEGALLLAEAEAEVLLIHRRNGFTARQEYVRAVLSHPRIRLMANSTVRQIVGTSQVEGIVVRQLGGEQNHFGIVEQLIPVDAVFVRIGVEPNSRLVQGQLALDADGYVLVDEAMETSAADVFAVGDLCTRPKYSSIVMATAQGMMAAKSIVFRIIK